MIALSEPKIQPDEIGVVLLDDADATAGAGIVRAATQRGILTSTIRLTRGVELLEQGMPQVSILAARNLPSPEQWPQLADLESKTLLLNSSPWIAFAASDRHFRSAIQSRRLETRGEGREGAPRVSVVVVGDSAIAARQPDQFGEWYRPSRSIARVAVKAAWALRLDHAVIDLRAGVTDWEVIAADPTPDLARLSDEIESIADIYGVLVENAIEVFHR